MRERVLGVGEGVGDERVGGWAWVGFGEDEGVGGDGRVGTGGIWGRRFFFFFFF